MAAEVEAVSVAVARRFRPEVEEQGHTAGAEGERRGREQEAVLQRDGAEGVWAAAATTVVSKQVGAVARVCLSGWLLPQPSAGELVTLLRRKVCAGGGVGSGRRAPQEGEGGARAAARQENRHGVRRTAAWFVAFAA